MNTRKYPTEWSIVLAHGPNWWNSSWDKYMVGEWDRFKENSVVIEWERYIAPYHIEKKIQQITLNFPQCDCIIGNSGKCINCNK